MGIYSKPILLLIISTLSISSKPPLFISNTEKDLQTQKA